MWNDIDVMIMLGEACRVDEGLFTSRDRNAFALTTFLRHRIRGDCLLFSKLYVGNFYLSSS